MKRATAVALAGLLCAPAAGVSQAPAPPAPKHDPFDWSTLKRTADGKPGTPQPREPEASHPRLKAIMHSPSGSFVNLDGVILGVGDSVNGLRLVAVRPYSAVFVRNGATVEMDLQREVKP